MSLFISILWLTLTTGFYVFVLKKKYEIVFPLSFISGFLFLFFFGLTGHISYGYYLSWILPLALFLRIIIALIKHDKEVLSEFKRNIFSVGFFVSEILTVYFFFLNRYSGFRFYDEFSFWGPMVKEILRLDTFYSVPETVLSIHKDYPPFFSLIETLWCYFSNGIYSEAYCFRAMNTFMMSLFVPVLSLFDNKDRKNTIPIILTVIIFMLLPFTVYTVKAISDGFTVYNTIYTDWAIGLFTAYSLFIVFAYEKDGFRNINIALCLFALVSMKQVGLPLSLIVLVFYVLSDFKKLKDRKHLLSIAVMVVVISASFFTWKAYITSVGADVNAQFSLSQFSLSSITSFLKGEFKEAYQKETVISFIEALYSKKIFTKPFNITFVSDVMIITALILVFSFITGQHKTGFSISGIYFAGSLGYILMMLLLYVFSFNSYEAPRLASYERYMGSYLYTGICLVFFSLIYLLKKEENIYRKITVLCLLLCCTISASNISDYRNLIPAKEYDGNISALSYQRTRYVMTQLCRNKKVLIVECYQNKGIYTGLILKYEFANDDSIDVDIFNIYNFSFKELSTDEWKDKLSGYDLIYLSSIDDEFINGFWKPVTDKYVQNFGLYSVDTSDGLKIEFLGSYQDFDLE